MSHEERDRPACAGPTRPQPSPSEQPDETDDDDNSAPGDTGAA